MGLDRPAVLRYFEWLVALLQGDPGQSLVANLPVREIIAQRLPNSLMLAGFTALISVPLALLIGISSAINRGGALDRALNILTLSMVALPQMMFAPLLLFWFFVTLGWLPGPTELGPAAILLPAMAGGAPEEAPCTQAARWTRPRFWRK